MVVIQWWALMAAVVTGHFLWVTVLAAFVGIVVGELGFCLKTDRRPSRIALPGSILSSMSVIAAFVTYKMFFAPEPEPYVPEQRTNATVRMLEGNRVPNLKHIAGCNNPSDTILWMYIAKGGTRTEHPVDIANFEAQYAHDCGFFIIDTREFVEGPATAFSDVEMLCIKDLFNTNVCRWIPASTIELDPDELERRRSGQ
jgi:hypothetical protein